MEYISLLLAIGLAFILFWRSKHSVAYRHSAKRQSIERKKEIVIEYLKHHGHLTNDIVQELLEVSDSTATHYLDELETEGKIKQIGKTGRGVHYVFK